MLREYRKNRVCICLCTLWVVVGVYSWYLIYSLWALRCRFYCFGQCEGLIRWNDNVESTFFCIDFNGGSRIIDAFAFYGCSALTKINIPSSVKRIEEQAFADCSMLAEVTLNEGLTYIGDWAFGALQKLKSITIPSTVEDMGFQSFYNCKNLAKIIWNAKHCSDFVSVLASPFSIYNYSQTDMEFYKGNVFVYADGENPIKGNLYSTPDKKESLTGNS